MKNNCETQLVSVRMKEMEALPQENNHRPKSERRLRYDRRVLELIEKNGSLEKIRAGLGLSQKQICELLMVDASAWSRWLKDKESAPHHVHQALDWYLGARRQNEAIESSIEVETLRKEVVVLSAELKKQEARHAGWKISVIASSIFIFYFILDRFF